jgi:hypothetical protein
MKKWIATLAIALCAVTATATPPDIEEIEGVVQNLTTYAVTTDDGDMIYETDVYVKVTRRIRGDSDMFVTIRVVGGTLNGLTMVSSNESVPTKNKKYHIIFNTDSHSKKRIVGGNNGIRLVQ